VMLHLKRAVAVAMLTMLMIAGLAYSAVAQPSRHQHMMERISIAEQDSPSQEEANNPMSVAS